MKKTKKEYSEYYKNSPMVKIATELSKDRLLIQLGLKVELPTENEYVESALSGNDDLKAYVFNVNGFDTYENKIGCLWAYGICDGGNLTFNAFVNGKGGVKSMHKTYVYKNSTKLFQHIVTWCNIITDFDITNKKN